jgi:hypothetical protein
MVHGCSVVLVSRKPGGFMFDDDQSRLLIILVWQLRAKTSFECLKILLKFT